MSSIHNTGFQHLKIRYGYMLSNKNFKQARKAVNLFFADDQFPPEFHEWKIAALRMLDDLEGK